MMIGNQKALALVNCLHRLSRLISTKTEGERRQGVDSP